MRISFGTVRSWRVSSGDKIIVAMHAKEIELDCDFPKRTGVSFDMLLPGNVRRD